MSLGYLCVMWDVIIWKAANRSVPYCNWQIEWEFQYQNIQKVSSLEWNVSYFMLTQMTFHLVIWSINDVA